MKDEMDKEVHKRHNLAKERENQEMRKTYAKPQRQNRFEIFRLRAGQQRPAWSVVMRRRGEKWCEQVSWKEIMKDLFKILQVISKNTVLWFGTAHTPPSICRYLSKGNTLHRQTSYILTWFFNFLCSIVNLTPLPQGGDSFTDTTLPEQGTDAESNWPIWAVGHQSSICL